MSRLNIYYLDTDARLCAQYHVDRHLSRAVLETVQLLGMAHQIRGAGVDLTGMPLLEAEVPAQVNHPWASWTRQTVANYQWMHDFAYWLQREAESRHGPAMHSMGQHLRALEALPLALASPTVDSGAGSSQPMLGPQRRRDRYTYGGPLPPEPPAEAGAAAGAAARASAGAGALTLPPQTVPVLYRRYGGALEAVKAYRQFYFECKQHLAIWTPPAGMPHWWREALDKSVRKS